VVVAPLALAEKQVEVRYRPRMYRMTWPCPAGVLVIRSECRRFGAPPIAGSAARSSPRPRFSDPPLYVPFSRPAAVIDRSSPSEGTSHRRLSTSCISNRIPMASAGQVGRT
jgi:hypothetical protein